jgi:cation diffusion facilitator CzcD-associated flavoprotein CzcO
MAARLKPGKKEHNTPSSSKAVDLLVVGGGPASLGFVVNALKNGKFSELIKDDGMAIIDAGTSFGGGNLCTYGINSNTSANGFVKCILRKVKEPRPKKPATPLQPKTTNLVDKKGPRPKIEPKSTVNTVKKPAAI